MRLIIDGYNVIFALGWIDPYRELPRRHLERVRRRFLNHLVDRTDSELAYATVVVFDSNDKELPRTLPKESTHKGVTVQFAIDEESADDRIALLVSRHARPKDLVVVSTDREVRAAAERRRARALTSDEFLLDLQSGQCRFNRLFAHPKLMEDDLVDQIRQLGPDPEEAAYWRDQFRHLEIEQQAYREHDPFSRFIPQDVEVARIAREVEAETRLGLPYKPTRVPPRRPG